MSGSSVRFVLLCPVRVALSARNTTHTSDGSPDPSELTRAWLVAWDSHDVDRILSFYTPDAFCEGVPSVETDGTPLGAVGT